MLQQFGSMGGSDESRHDVLRSRMNRLSPEGRRVDGALPGALPGNVKHFYEFYRRLRRLAHALARLAPSSTDARGIGSGRGEAAVILTFGTIAMTNAGHDDAPNTACPRCAAGWDPALQNPSRIARPALEEQRISLGRAGQILRLTRDETGECGWAG